MRFSNLLAEGTLLRAKSSRLVELYQLDYSSTSKKYVVTSQTSEAVPMSGSRFRYLRVVPNYGVPPPQAAGDSTEACLEPVGFIDPCMLDTEPGAPVRLLANYCLPTKLGKHQLG